MAEITREMFNINDDNQNRTINDYLIKGEKILWHEKPNAKSFVWSKVSGIAPFALIWLIIDMSIIFSILFISNNLPVAVCIFLIIFFLIHLAPVWVCINMIVKSRTEAKCTEYFITNKRVIVSLLPRSLQIKEINIKDINSVSLSQKLLDGLLKVGDITISTENKKTITLFDIKQPEKIYTIFQKVKNNFKNLKDLPEVIVCEYCGTTLSSGSKKCESCGAVYNEND